jgi:hypothetical protein
MSPHHVPPRLIALTILCSVAVSARANAQVGDPQLRTDHPYFPGELALSTPARVIATALATPRGTLGNGTNRDKLIRLFLWRAEHYGHLHSPAIYNLPGVKPNPLAANQLMTDNDGMRGLFSYGFGLCGTNHAQMRPFAEALGWTDRRVQLVNDTGYEIFVDGKWRYVNTDQYTLHFESSSPGAQPTTTSSSGIPTSGSASGCPRPTPMAATRASPGSPEPWPTARCNGATTTRTSGR